ncbi:unnamed protein product [Urochloa humidicola]
MATAPRAKRERRRRLDEDEEKELVDRISRHLNDVLSDIICVSLLPYKDRAHTQVLSSRWRSAPLNLDLNDIHTLSKRISTDDVSRILSAHQGPGRCFYSKLWYLGSGAHSMALEGWLRSPALDKLQELKFDFGHDISSQ